MSRSENFDQGKVDAEFKKMIGAEFEDPKRSSGHATFHAAHAALLGKYLDITSEIHNTPAHEEVSDETLHKFANHARELYDFTEVVHGLHNSGEVTADFNGNIRCNNCGENLPAPWEDDV